jgi:hypothetical protein
MADPSTPDALEWLNRVWGFIVGVAGTIIGMGSWVSSKMGRMETRMDTMQKEFTERNHLAATNIVQLQAYHESNIQRLAAIEMTTRGIDEKLDELLQTMASKRRDRS